jgi:hypothetical protein
MNGIQTLLSLADVTKAWEKWFEGVDLLQVKSTETEIAFHPST